MSRAKTPEPPPKRERSHSYAEWSEAAWMMSETSQEFARPKRLPNLSQIEKSTRDR